MAFLHRAFGATGVKSRRANLLILQKSTKLTKGKQAIHTYINKSKLL